MARISAPAADCFLTFSSRASRVRSPSASPLAIGSARRFPRVGNGGKFVLAENLAVRDLIDRINGDLRSIERYGRGNYLGNPSNRSARYRTWRKCTGIEPAVPPLSRSTIGFEDRARHQSRKHFRARIYTRRAGQPSGSQPPPRARQRASGRSSLRASGTSSSQGSNQCDVRALARIGRSAPPNSGLSGQRWCQSAQRSGRSAKHSTSFTPPLQLMATTSTGPGRAPDACRRTTS